MATIPAVLAVVSALRVAATATHRRRNRSRSRE